MNVSLSPQLEKLIGKKVASGMYNSASEVVREALRLLAKRDRLYESTLKALRQDLRDGIADLEQGRYSEYDDSTLGMMVDEITTAGRQRLAARKRRRA